MLTQRMSIRLNTVFPWVVVWLLLTGCATAQNNYQITYRSETRVDRNTLTAQVFIAYSNGRNEPHELYPGISWVTWSPDGAKVLTLYEGKVQSLNPLNGERICVTCGLEDLRDLDWSPQGDRLAISTDTALYVADADGSNRIELAETRSAWQLSWSPDESSLVFAASSGYDGIFQINLVDGTLVNLSPGTEGKWFAPQWSPIENKIAFVSRSSEGYYIQIMNSDGSDVTRVAEWDYKGEFFDPGGWEPPQWSPDGKKLLFVSAEPGGADIFLVNADSSGLTNLTNSHSPQGAEYSPTWSPDGRQIAFVSTRDGNPEVYVMNADGSNPINISNSPDTRDIDPTWRPQPPQSPPYAFIRLLLIIAGIVLLMISAALAIYMMVAGKRKVSSAPRRQ